MSCETLVLRMSSDSESSSPAVDPSTSQPFLAEEAYPLILRALVDTRLGQGDEERICLNEDNISAIARAASGALFGLENPVFSQFLVVPRVECAISVLLWRVRVNSTCADDSTLGLPSVPVHVLASSLAGLLDNTKLYASSKHAATKQTPTRRLVDHSPVLEHLSIPTTSRSTSDTSSPLRFASPMTPPDSAAADMTPMASTSSIPTPKRSVKFRPPPIITRTTPSRPIPGRAQSTSAITLNFATTALAEYEIEPLQYIPKPDQQAKQPPSPVKDPESASRPASPSRPRSRSRPPSPNPPPPSPGKRLLKKAPPGLKPSKSFNGKNKARVKVKPSSSRPSSPTKNKSMWTPAGVEAHFQTDTSARTLTGRLPLPQMTGSVDELGSTSGLSASGLESGAGTPSASKLGTSLPSDSPALRPDVEIEAPTPKDSPVAQPALLPDAEPEQNVPTPSRSTSLRTPSRSGSLRTPSRSASLRTPSPSSTSRTPSPNRADARTPSPGRPNMSSPSPHRPTSSLNLLYSPGSNLLKSPASSMFRGSAFGSPASIVRNGSPASILRNGSPAPASILRMRTDSNSQAPQSNDSSSQSGSSLRAPQPDSIRPLSVDGITIIAVSPEATPVTPTPRRTGFKHNVEGSPTRHSGVDFEMLTPAPRDASMSPGAMSLGTGTPAGMGVGASPGMGLGASLGMGLGASPGMGLGASPAMSLSPGAMSFSTVPSLSPFPESDSEAEFGFGPRDEEDLTVTRSRARANGSPVRRASRSPTKRFGSRSRGGSRSPLKDGSMRRNGSRSPVKRDGSRSPTKDDSMRRSGSQSPFKRNGSPVKSSDSFKRRTPPRNDTSPTLSRATSPSRSRATSPAQVRIANGVALRALTSTPPRRTGTPQGVVSPSKSIPNRSWTDSPSRASTSSRQTYTIGVPMTQVSSRPRTMSTHSRSALGHADPVESGVSESEAESLPFPGSQSTLSLPGDVSLPEMPSPFSAPKELPSSSESETPSPWLGAGVTSSPWPGRPAEGSSSSSSPSPWMGASELNGSLLMNGSLPGLGLGLGVGSGESPVRSSVSPVRSSVETSRPRSGTRSSRTSVDLSGRASVDYSGRTSVDHSGRTSVDHSGRTSVDHSGRASVEFSSRMSVDSHTTTTSTAMLKTHPGMGRKTGDDLLVPYISSTSMSRSDVIKLLGRTNSIDMPFLGNRDSCGSPVHESLPARGTPLATVDEYNQPLPVFMVPGAADPATVSSESRPTSLVRAATLTAPKFPVASPESSSPSTDASPILPAQRPPLSRIASETSEESVVLNADGQAMVRTTEVGVGAGRVRVQTGVGVGVSRARGGSVVKAGVKSKVDSGLRKRVDSKAKVEDKADSARPRVDSTRSRVDSVTRPRVDSVRARVDTGLRRKPVANTDSPSSASPATPVSAASRSGSTASTRRVPVRKPSSDTMSRARKSSVTSMRKSSTSSLRSTPPTTVSSPSARKSSRTTSFSSGTSTPRSTTPRSSGAFSPRSRSISAGGATPKPGTPRTTPTKSSVASPKATSPKTTAQSPRTSVAAPRPLPPRPVPPARPQRSALRPGPRTSVLETSAPAIPMPTPVEVTPTTTSPPRNRATSLDTKSVTSVEAPRLRRNTSVSSKTPSLSRSSTVTTSTAAPPVPSATKARANRVSVQIPSESSNAIPFPESGEGGLKVPETPRSLRRSLSVSSAARKLVGRGRAPSPVPPTPPVDNASLAASTGAVSVSSVEKSPQKPARSLSRLAFSALLPKRSNNAAAEAKAALAAAKAKEVAEAKARAKAAAEEAKARAKAEAEEAKAARAAKAKEEKEAKKMTKRFGSISKRGGQ